MLDSSHLRAAYARNPGLPSFFPERGGILLRVVLRVFSFCLERKSICVKWKKLRY